MSNNWKDKRQNSSSIFDPVGIINDLLGNPLGSEHTVENEETGEYKNVFVGSDQLVGDAISKGQFTDRDTSDWKK